ncbi:NADPH-dependent FMN reductase [Xenorhabdus sp. IM139775]|uniref:NADPH-dependent FMN reductase n=1 Tax=Xenorhabdus sp. IM139775 TaxID=3025876 RepID=UPI002359653A|nr:NADPH-dependent FMN reductase [Xenorhabdus sp. IM139775]MDC9594157.1 NAD(P)H-dependent oxidoreductase [Xenorhabdus sp. IM139775]
MKNTYNILGISGSLRNASLNMLFLRAMGRVCPDNMNFEIYSGLGAIPLFNADDEDKSFPEVSHWCNALARADLVLLVSPEYAHGVTGVMKNALDWIVSTGILIDKPLAFPNISIRAELAQSQLAETLQTMGCRLIEECSPRATLAAPYVIPDATEHMLVDHPDIGPRLKILWSNIEHSLTASP